MGAVPIAGEKVAGEQEVKALAVKAAMSLGMTGKMDDAQSTPVRQLDLGEKGMIDRNGLVPEKSPPSRLHKSAQAAWPAVRKHAVDMPLLQGMGQYGGACQFLQQGEIACMVEVSVGQKDCLDIRPTQAELTQNVPQAPYFPHQAGVDQYCLVAVGVVKKVKRSCQPSDWVNSTTGFQRNIV